MQEYRQLGAQLVIASLTKEFNRWDEIYTLCRPMSDTAHQVALRPRSVAHRRVERVKGLVKDKADGGDARSWKNMVIAAQEAVFVFRASVLEHHRIATIEAAKEGETENQQQLVLVHPTPLGVALLIEGWVRR